MKFEGVVPKSNKPFVPDSMKSNGHWEFPDKMGVGVGFIYIIYDTALNRGYIGKKTYITKKNDWRTYKSSSKLLKEMFRERPIEEFRFICLEQYNTKGTLSYAETWSLCAAEAPTSTAWYNTLIPKVSWAVKEPISDRHKDRLKEIIDEIN